MKYCFKWIVTVSFSLFSLIFGYGQVVNPWSNFGPYGKGQDIRFSYKHRGNGRVTSIDFHPTDPNTLYIGTNGGIWKSTNDGASWVNLNTDQQIGPLGIIQSIVVDQSNPNYIYATTGSNSFGVFSSGVFRTIDGGTTWQRIVNGLPSKFDSPNCFTNLENNTSGTGGTGGFIYQVIVCPFDPNTLFICTDAGMYYTNNARSTTPQWYGLSTPLTDVRYISYSPGSTSGSYTIYISGSTGIAMSSNLTSWTTLTGSSFGQLNINADADITSNFSIISRCIYHTDVSLSDGVLYALATVHGKQMVGSDTWDRGFKLVYKYSGGVWTKVISKDFKIINVGATTTEIVDPFEVAAFDAPITVDRVNPSNLYIGGGNVAVVKGSTWYKTNSYDTESCRAVHADHRCIKQSPHNGYLYTGNDGFLSKLDVNNAAVTSCNAWVDLENANLCIAMVSNFSQSVDNPNYVLAGLFDDGTSRYFNGSWKSLGGGDGFHNLIVTEETVYYRINSSLNKMTIPLSGGAITNRSIPYPKASINGYDDVVPYNRCGPSESLALVNATNRSSIYVSGFDISNLTIDAPTSTGMYTRKSNFMSSPFNVGWNVPIHSIQTAKTDSNVIYVSLAPYYLDAGAQYRTRMFKTVNGGASWMELYPPVSTAVPDFCITGIAISATNKNKVFICYNGINTSYKVKISNDGGATWSDYHNSSSITAPINAIAYEEGSNDGLYVATLDGIYYTNNTMTNWISYSNSLPKVPINDIDVSVKGNKIRASTFGRGMWEAYLYCSPVTNLNINSSYPGVVSGNIPLNTPYETGGSMTVSAIVQSNSYTTFRSSQGIQFTNGFRATSGSNVKAYICPCGTSLPSLKLTEGDALADVGVKEQVVPEEEFIQMPDLSVYPNPSLGNFMLKLPKVEEEVKEVFIYDIKGDLIEDYSFYKTESGEIHFSIGPSVLTGRYIMRLVSTEKSYITTVLIVSGTFQEEELEKD